MTLDEKLVQDIKKTQAELAEEGKLFPLTQLQGFYETFRKRFGPEHLKNLDGEALLNTMHNHSDRDSLVYWLEFKNDDELPAIFGSIAGGSALKFGIYRRKETGIWMTGSPQDQRELSIEEAVQIARTHRDQLIRGAELLERFPANATDVDYAALQEDMAEAAPDVSDSVWGHKYFSMLYPDKLDDYHNPDYQRFHLIKLLQVPPEGNGRYLVAGRYVAIANELGMPLNHLTTILNHRDGNPHRYWRVLVNYPNAEGFENNWDLMRGGSYAAIGWAELGDLSGIQHNRESKNHVRSLMKSHYGDKGRWANEIFNFVATMAEGDLVLAFEGLTLLGIGRVIGTYAYVPSTPKIPHRRPVEWLAEGKWELPQSEAKGRAIGELKQPANLVEIERHLLDVSLLPPSPLPSPSSGAVPQLRGVPGRIQSVLERKGQVILYGPPGTGKTYWAIRVAYDLAAYSSFGCAFDQLTDEQKQFVVGNGQGSEGLMRMCSFHPAYGYEDFLEGYKPVTANNQLVFERHDGIFKRLCEEAQKNPDHRFYLVIDEINRGDIPRIFGELLTILEKDKRGRSILLPLSGAPFYVPGNVYVIGTMNTADRSIALLDTALRRRFGFIELMPDSSILRGTVVGGIPLAPWLDALNRRICDHIGRDARNLQIGHAYLLDNGQPVSDFARFARIVQDDVVPLLEEYCYEDYTALERILGKGLVDENAQRIRHELFDSSRKDELIAALLVPCPEIVTSAQAVASEAAEPEEALDEEDEQDVEETVPPV